jgi:hypothetical protein
VSGRYNITTLAITSCYDVTTYLLTDIIHAATCKWNIARATGNRWKLNTDRIVTNGGKPKYSEIHLTQCRSVAFFAANIFIYTTPVVNLDLCPKKLATEYDLELTSQSYSCFPFDWACSSVLRWFALSEMV